MTQISQKSTTQMDVNSSDLRYRRGPRSAVSAGTDLTDLFIFKSSIPVFLRLFLRSFLEEPSAGNGRAAKVGANH